MGEQGRNTPVKPATDAFDELLDRLRVLHSAKRSDYTAGGHPLANYAFSARMVGLSAERGIFMRICEKVYRIRSLYEKQDRGGEAEVAESMDDTDMDIAIMAMLRILARQVGSGYE